MNSNLGPRLKKSWPYMLVTFLFYTVMPYAAAYIEMTTGAQRGTLFNMTPILDCCASIAIGYFYGRRCSRDPIMPVWCAAMFALAMIIYYGSSAWIYVPLAALSSFIGQCFGNLYRRL